MCFRLIDMMLHVSNSNAPFTAIIWIAIWISIGVAIQKLYSFTRALFTRDIKSLFNITKYITLLFIVQSLLHRNPPYIWIRISHGLIIVGMI